ncbi:D-alanyl-D-alanine carboxypeptidase family protein [Chachezhania antarctica]|uniref:D-alanyl-D-alanine carboxypeptidase family protein n=1 Tax=Chachezhania antarctica TaxID=2340860 RepID=UPI000EB13C2F|nr:D-alanyl-D-alanine carboxypeptidase family protein [Chachezhania antarctica]|tara:strand:- start:1584 stop:2768 length:1185 start_codon:yes stop_codon:yes gene_type:complete
MPIPLPIDCLRVFALGLVLTLTAGMAAAFDTPARAAFVMDHDTGTVLFEKNADLPLPPASMSKLMTIYLALEAVRDGRLDLDQRLPVSPHAMSYGGSTMFLDTTDTVTVDELLKGIIVLSGNDASAVIAEALSPDRSEAGFAQLMNERARQLGMTNSTFANSNGWPDPIQRMSVRDLGILANRIITDFPDFYPYFAMQTYEFDGRAPANTRNRNPLLSMGIGADGLKTGHTQEAGYGLVGSGTRDGRRTIFVVSGLESEGQRAREAAAILDWSFRHFTPKTLAQAGEKVGTADVWLGRRNSVDLVVGDALNVLLPVPTQDTVEAEIRYDGPVQAPITKGQELGRIVILRGDELEPMSRPLLAAEDVKDGGYFARVKLSAQFLLSWIGSFIPGLT